VPSADQTVRMYEELATLSDRQGQPQMHDRFLVLAADAALSAGRSDEAERLRRCLLQHNPHHLLKPYASFEEAMQASDVVSYVVALRRSHPEDASTQLLNSLRKDQIETNNDPLEGATMYTAEGQWSMNLDAPQAPEALKVYRGQEPAETPKPKPAEVKPPKKSRVEPVESPRPKTTRQPAPPPVVRPKLKPVKEEPAADAPLPPTLTVPKPRANPVPAPAVPPSPRPQPAPIPRQPTTAKPAPTRDVYPLRAETPAARPRLADVSASDDEDTVHTGSYWLSTFLCGLLAVLGGGLGVYTLARPFTSRTRHP
jgi:hypothetical protein